MKRCSTPLTVRDSQVKPQWDITPYLLEWTVRTKPWPCACWWKCRVAGRNASGTVMLERKCVSGFICNLLEPETQKGTFLPLSHVYLLSICTLLGVIVVNITNTGQWGFWILQIKVFRFWGLMIVYMSAHFSFTSMHFLKNQISKIKVYVCCGAPVPSFHPHVINSRKTLKHLQRAWLRFLHALSAERKSGYNYFL